MSRRVVFLASPLRGNYERNIAYAKACTIDSIAKGEAPFVPHLLYSQVLDDKDVEERRAGLSCGSAWIPRVSAIVVYTDYGISEGMFREITEAESCGVPVEFRKIAFNDSAFAAQSARGEG